MLEMVQPRALGVVNWLDFLHCKNLQVETTLLVAGLLLLLGSLWQYNKHFAFTYGNSAHSTLNSRVLNV